MDITEEDDDLKPKNYNSPVAAPPTAGAQVATATQPAPRPADDLKPKPQLPVNLPPYQANLEPSRPEFDPAQHLARVQTAYSSFYNGTGATPTADVAHDLARSGLRDDAIQTVAKDMWSKLPPGKDIPAGSVSELRENRLTIDEKTKAGFKTFKSVPNAPFRGIVWDPAQNAYLVNPDERGPLHEAEHQLRRGITSAQDAINFLNQARKISPAAVAAAATHTARGDFVTAALQVQREIGGKIGNVKAGVDKAGRDLQFKAYLADNAARQFGAAQFRIDADIIDRMHDYAVKAGTYIGYSAVKTGLFNIGDQGNIGIGPNANADTALGALSKAFGEAASGQHIGSHVSLTDEARKQWKLKIDSNTSLTREQREAGERYVDSFDPKNMNMYKSLSGLERAKIGGEATIGLVSMGTPQGLFSTLMQTGTTGALLDNGVNHDIATVAGDIVGVASLGRSALSLRGFATSGGFQKAGALAGGIGNIAYSLDQSAGQDDIEKFANAATAGLIGVTAGRHIGGGVDRYRAGIAANRTIGLTLRAATGEAVAKATLDRQAAQAETVKTLRATADAKLQAISDLATKPSPQKEAPAGMGKGLEEDKLQAQRNVAEGKTGPAAWRDEQGNIHYRDEEPAQPKSILPPVKPGHVRLYRGENLPGGEPETEFERGVRGRWFTDNPRYARIFSNEGTPTEEMGQYKYADVPEHIADKASLEHLKVKNEQALFNLRKTESFKDVTETPSRDEVMARLNQLEDQINKGPSADYGDRDNPLWKEIIALRDAMPHLGDLKNEKGFLLPSKHAEAALAYPSEIHNKIVEEYDRPGETIPTEIAPLTKQWVDAVKEHTDAEVAYDKANDQLQRQIVGDINTPARKAGNAYNTLRATQIRTDQKGYAVINMGSKIVKAINILGESVAGEIRNVLKGDEFKFAAFREGIWHPEVIPNIEWPEVRQLVIDVRAILADAASSMPDNMKAEILNNFFPLKGERSGEVLKSILTPDDPLPGHTGHEIEREPRSEEQQRAGEAKRDPANDIKEYLQEVGRAEINRTVRAALGVSIDPKDGTRAYIPEHEIGPNGRSEDLTELTNGKKYVWSGAPGLRGLVDARLASALESMAKPGSDIGLGYRAFTSLYKQIAMKSPVHPWNQSSASIGIEMNIAHLIGVGAELTKDPALLQEAAKYSNLGTAEQSIYDMTDRLVIGHPLLDRMLNQLRSIEKHTTAHYDHIVWTSYIRNLQAGIWKTLVERAIAAGAKPEDAKIAAGHFADEITGKLDPNMLSGVERFLQRYFFFAYAWNRKHITIPAEAFHPSLTKKISPWLSDEQASLVTNMAREYIGRQQANAWMMHTMASLLIAGHPPWENEDGRLMDIETTRLVAIIAKIEGREPPTTRSYSQNGFMNFINWYWKKGTIVTDFGGTNAVQGILQNFTDLSSPIPAFLLTLGADMPYENLGESVGRGVQEMDPWQRNQLGPLAKEELKIQEGKVAKPRTPVEAAEDIFSSVPVFITGLQQYQGKRTQFTPTPQKLRDDKGVALELAREGIDPHQATAKQIEEARKQYGVFLGVNLKEVGEMVLGSPSGTGSHYQELTQWLNTQIHKGVVEQLTGTTQSRLGHLNAGSEEQTAAEDKYAKAIRDGVSPFKLLDSMQKAMMFKNHPEIGYALNAPSTDPDPAVRRIHDEVVMYNVGLNKRLTENHNEQKKLDAGLGDETLKLSDWIKKTHDLRTADSLAFKDLQGALSPEALAKVQKKPDDITPMLPAEQAYWTFRNSIDYSDPKFQDAEGVVDIKAYKKAQEDFLKTLPPDQASYIQNRELQSQTPTVQKYMNAAAIYNKFKDDNPQVEAQRKVYNTLTPFEKKIYRAAYPDVDGYLTYRENWFRTDPDGMKAAEFYHPTDEKQWKQWDHGKQAAALAEWILDAQGSAKQQGYLTPWQKQVVGSQDLVNHLTADWTDADNRQVNDMITAYYNEEAAYRNNRQSYMLNLIQKSKFPSVLGG